MVLLSFDRCPILICINSLVGFLKRRLRRRRLTDLERTLFGIERENDIPGQEIPNAYYRFLHRGEFDDLWRVIEHNQQDMDTMPLILSWLVKGCASSDGFDDPRDELGYIERAVKRGMDSDARDRLEKLMVVLEPPSLRGEARCSNMN